MRCIAVLCCVAATFAGVVRGQEPAPPPAESVRAESTAPAAEPTLEQKRFLDGLRTASRGVAQVKDGLSRVTRARALGDSASQRRAGRFLAGLCGSARGFMARGRPRMQSTAYEDSSRVMARRLATQIDSLMAFMPKCEQGAGKTPSVIATDLGKRMKSYDTAVNNFRAAVGLPVRGDSAPTSRRQ